MLKIILLLVAVAAVFGQNAEERPCAYWCEAPCRAKVVAFYCCSYTPSLVGPETFLPPPCTDLCANRPANLPSHMRDCRQEIQALKTAGTYMDCTNFQDCDPTMHDVCCRDNCLPDGRNMCVTL